MIQIRFSQMRMYILPTHSNLLRKILTSKSNSCTCHLFRITFATRVPVLSIKNKISLCALSIPLFLFFLIIISSLYDFTSNLKPWESRMPRGDDIAAYASFPMKSKITVASSMILFTISFLPLVRLLPHSFVRFLNPLNSLPEYTY